MNRLYFIAMAVLSTVLCVLGTRAEGHESPHYHAVPPHCQGAVPRVQLACQQANGILTTVVSFDPTTRVVSWSTFNWCSSGDIPFTLADERCYVKRGWIVTLRWPDGKVRRLSGRARNRAYILPADKIAAPGEYEVSLVPRRYRVRKHRLFGLAGDSQHGVMGYRFVVGATTTTTSPPTTTTTATTTTTTTPSTASLPTTTSTTTSTTSTTTTTTVTTTTSTTSTTVTTSTTTTSTVTTTAPTTSSTTVTTTTSTTSTTTSTTTTASTAAPTTTTTTTQPTTTSTTTTSTTTSTTTTTAPFAAQGQGHGEMVITALDGTGFPIGPDGRMLITQPLGAGTFGGQLQIQLRTSKPRTSRGTLFVNGTDPAGRLVTFKEIPWEVGDPDLRVFPDLLLGLPGGRGAIYFDGGLGDDTSSTRIPDSAIEFTGILVTGDGITVTGIDDACYGDLIAFDPSGIPYNREKDGTWVFPRPTKAGQTNAQVCFEVVSTSGRLTDGRLFVLELSGALLESILWPVGDARRCINLPATELERGQLYFEGQLRLCQDSSHMPGEPASTDSLLKFRTVPIAP